MTKLSNASSGGFSPSLRTLKGGAPGSSNLRVGGWASTLEHARIWNKSAIVGLDMNSLTVSSRPSIGQTLRYLLFTRSRNGRHMDRTSSLLKSPTGTSTPDKLEATSQD